MIGDSGAARRIAAAILGLLVLAGALLGCRPATAQEARLGGGSDLPNDAVIPIAAGGGVGPIHHVFADNPEGQPIEVEFRADAPEGIRVVPERTAATIAPGTTERLPFAIEVDEGTPPGDHQVTVQLVRADIEPQPGSVTTIPAVGTTFAVRVTGDAGRLVVQAVSAESGRPVEGDLSIVSLAGAGPGVAVATGTGSELEATVPPGRYRATYAFQGRQLAASEVEVAADEEAQVVLEVSTLSFVTVGATPVREGGKVVLAELVAAVENHLGPLGPAELGATVHRDGEEVDTVQLQRLPEVPPGVTEARLPYRPEGGFPPGTYDFRFFLETDDGLRLEAAQPASFTVEEPGPFTWLAVVAGAILAGVVILLLLGRRRERGSTTQAGRIRP